MKNKIPWIVVGAMLLLFTFAFLEFFGHYNASETLTTLLTGWAVFLANNARRMQTDPASLLTFAILLIGFGFAVHCFGAMVYESIKEKQGQPTQWRTRWTVAIASTSILLFCAGMTGVGLFSHLAWIATAEDRSILEGEYPYEPAFDIGFDAVQSTWSTDRVKDEARMIVAKTNGQYVVRVVTGEDGQWRAIVSYDSKWPIDRFTNMSISTRDDADRGALHRLNTIEEIFDYYKGK